MLHLYVLYACVYVNAGKSAHRAPATHCVEQQIFLDPDRCKKELPKGGRLTERTRHERAWSECKDTQASSWISTHESDRGISVYKLTVDASDAKALDVLLAPLSPEARRTLVPDDFKRPFVKAFQGPGDLSFFIVGTGSRVIAFALTNLNDFQFTDVATDVSSSAATMKYGDLDFETIAEDAGIELSHHTEMSSRDAPPPGGIEAEH